MKDVDSFFLLFVFLSSAFYLPFILLNSSALLKFENLQREILRRVCACKQLGT